MPGRVRFRLLVRIIVIFVLLGTAVLGLSRWLSTAPPTNRFIRVAARLLVPSGKPPATHPLLPIPSEPLSLTTSTPTHDELRSLVAGSNLVICVIDAARVDHMGCYGYSRDTTPNIDRLASQSLVFEQHFCQYSETKPSTASLFTSLYPDSHLVVRTRTMAPRSFTMAQGLKPARFHNAFFSSNHWASPRMGIGGDFDWPRPSHRFGREPRESGEVSPPRSPARAQGSSRDPSRLLAQIQEWLDEGPDRPFFAYFHFLPPHSPYSAPDELKKIFAGKPVPSFWRGKHPFAEIAEKGGPSEHIFPTPGLVNLYDANLLWADWAVGEVERRLREAGLFDNTLFIVTADHGETFGEHGHKWHPSCPYDEVIRIPLLIKFPGEKGPAGRVRALTQTIDLLPTIFDLYQVPYPSEEIQGRSLVPLLAGEVEKVNDYIFSRTSGTPPAYVVHDLRSALVVYEGRGLSAFYDLEADPWQTRNVIEEQPERAAELIEAFREFALTQRRSPLHFVDLDAPAAEPPPVPEVPMSEEDRRELEALGYLR